MDDCWLEHPAIMLPATTRPVRTPLRFIPVLFGAPHSLGHLNNARPAALSKKCQFDGFFNFGILAVAGWVLNLSVMKGANYVIGLAAAIGIVTTLAACPMRSWATGTATVWQRNGSERTYNDVSIRLARNELALTTKDGSGTIVIGRAACTKVDALVKCLPYDATLFQNGWRDRILLKSGTVWLNPTSSKQTLPNSSAQVLPHGVQVSITSTKGTFISLSGTIDEVQK